MSELDDFLKDPEGWVKQQKQRQENRCVDALNYLNRQREILEETYQETIEGYAKEHEANMKRAQRWAAQHGIEVEDLDEM